MSIVNDQLALHFDASTVVYDENFNYAFTLGDYGFTAPRVAEMFYRDGVYWTADLNSGFVQVKTTGVKQISYPGPPKDAFYSMDWSQGRLAVCSGGVDGNVSTFNTGGVYIFENEEWELRDAFNMNLWQGQDIYDYLCVAMHPSNREQMAVGTFSFVPVSIMDETGQVMDTLTPQNSFIEAATIGVGKSLVTAMEYDAQGNLWILNGGGNKPLKVLTGNGEWQSFDMGTAAKTKFSAKMVIDNTGNKWMSFLNNGLYGYSDGGTPTDIGDDNYQYFSNGEGLGALPSTNVTALAVDHDNELWIGTDAGFAVLYNPGSAIGASSGDYDAQRIKVDFEGNIEYVLGATYITDIEVDGGNRKWFGTANSGLVLLSADGLEILEQHTMENSPLISNMILDLQLDHNTGELFIITDKGLVSYRTDASDGNSNYSNVTVFPNPVRPDFHGPVTIQGIKGDSDVRITDAAGNLVYETSSNGGTATWNGENIQGAQVETGVYLIWTAPREGKGRHVGKVLVVR